MAEVKTVKINVDTKGAVDAMENLSKATHDVSASFEEVYGDLQPLTTRMGEAEDRLYELANAGQTATQEYKDLLKTVGDYRKVQIQTDLAVDSAATTMAQKLGGALGGISAGYSLAQGVMGTFGIESERVEKTLVRIQSAMAISQGVQGLKEAIPTFKQLGTVAMDALKGIRTGIAATGIGVFLVAIGTIVAYWDDIKRAVGGVSKEQERLNAKAQKNVDIQRAKYESLGAQDNILKLQGKSEKEITLMKLNQIQAVIKATKAQLVQQENTKKAEVASEKRNYNILKTIARIGVESVAVGLRIIGAPLDALIATANAVSETLGLGKITSFSINKEITKMTEAASSSIAKLIFDPKETKEKADETIAETKAQLKQLENEAAGFKLTLQEMNKPADTTVKDAGKQVVEQAKAEVNSLKDFEVEKLEIRRASVDKTLEFQKLENEGLKSGLELRLQIRRTERELFQQKKQELMEGAEATAATLGQISKLFGEQTAVGKASAIAEATISTYLSAQKAYDSTIGVPVVGPVLAPINAGLAIAAGIKNIKAITAVKTPNGGGGGSSNVSNNFTSGTQAPSFNVVGNSGLNQLAQIQQTPVQAYVVSGEVTSAQALDRNRIKNATL